MMEFLITFCILSLIFVLFAGGKFALEGLFSSSGSTSPEKVKEKPVKVKNSEDKTGRFFVKDAYEWGCYGFFAKVCERANEDNYSHANAKTLAELEEEIEKAYVRLENTRQFNDYKDLRSQSKK